MHSLIEGKAYFYFHNIFSPEKINQSYLCPSFNNTQENSKKKNFNQNYNHLINLSSLMKYTALSMFTIDFNSAIYKI